MNSVKNLLIAAAALELSFRCEGEGVVDYAGHNVRDALEAVEAVDEEEISFFDTDGELVGWALIVNGLDEEERIADCSGWVNQYLDEA
jgi:hypothetical protein